MELVRHIPETIEAPKLRGLHLLHRHEDGFISFAVQSDDGVFLHLASIQRSQLESLFPEFRQRLEKDGYVSVNASYCETNSLTRSKASVQRGRDRDRYHSGKTLKYLCACYADIDYYNADLRFSEAYGYVLRAEEEGRIPRHSIAIDSGRGMWLLWLLRDERDPDHVHRGAWADSPLNHVLLYSGIQRKICTALSAIGCDKAGVDAARHVRVEGSLHTETEQFVQWFVRGDQAGVNAYTLKGLADFFGIRHATHGAIPSTRAAKQRGDRKPQPYHLKGHRAAGEAKINIIELLSNWRGGFEKGGRNKALSLYAMALRGAHLSQQVASDRAMELARHCRPPVGQAEVSGIIGSAYRQTKSLLRYQTIADNLTVTPAEAGELCLLTTKPFPAASSFPALARKLSRKEGMEIRHAAIKRIIHQHGPLSFREMQKQLSSEGIEASYVTVRADYAALGIQSQDTGERRKREDRQARQLKLIAVA